MGRRRSEEDSIAALEFAFCNFENDDEAPRRPSKRRSKRRREREKDKIAAKYLDANESLGAPDTFSHPNPLADDERKEDPQTLSRSSSSSSVSSLGEEATRVRGRRAPACFAAAASGLFAVACYVALAAPPAAGAVVGAWAAPRTLGGDVVAVADGGDLEALQWRYEGWDGAAYATKTSAPLALAACGLRPYGCVGSFSLGGAYGDDVFDFVEISAKASAGVLDVAVRERRAAGDDTTRSLRVDYGALPALVTAEVELSLAESEERRPFLRRRRATRAVRYAGSRTRLQDPDADRGARLVLRASGAVVREESRPLALSILADLGGALAVVAAGIALLAVVFAAARSLARALRRRGGGAAPAPDVIDV